MDHTSQASYISSSSDQPPTMIDTSASGDAFVSPDSPTPPQGSPEGGVVVNEEQPEVEIETTTLDPVVEVHIERPPVPQVISTDIDTPKKRAVRLALAETQNNEGRTSILRQQLLNPDIWKPDLPIGLSLKFSPDGKKITGVRSERTLQKGAKFGPFNGKLVDESVGTRKDSVWEVGIFTTTKNKGKKKLIYEEWTVGHHIDNKEFWSLLTKEGQQYTFLDH